MFSLAHIEQAMKQAPQTNVIDIDGKDYYYVLISPRQAKAIDVAEGLASGRIKRLPRKKKLSLFGRRK